MKSVIAIDETWTINSFRNSFNQAEDILKANNLPNADKPFASLMSQQKRTDTGTYDEDAHIQAIRQSLNDKHLASALSLMSPEDWMTYSLTQVINGFLSVPELLVTERESVTDYIREQIMRESSLEKIRLLLQPSLS